MKVEKTIKTYVSNDEYEGTQFNRIPKKRSFIRRKQNNLSEDKFIKVDKDRKKVGKDIQESNLEALTKSFAKMKIHICHRCHEKGHGERFCPNEMSDLNKAITPIIQYQKYLN